MALEISFWNKCNNNCVMCTSHLFSKREKFIDLASIKDYLDLKTKGRKHNIKEFYLTGGEPTMQPDFFGIIAFLQKEFPASRINILSNGRRFFYDDFTRACIALAKVNFIISIHGHNPKTHDIVTNAKGSFEQTVGGIKNILSLRKQNQEVEIRVVVTRMTLRNLRKTLDFIFKEFIQINRIVILFLKYEGQAIENLKTVQLSYGEFKTEISKLLPYLYRKKEIRFYHFPFCVMPKEFWPYMRQAFNKEDLVLLPKCSKCAVKKVCMGIHKNYFQLFGDREFKPVKLFV